MNTPLILAARNFCFGSNPREAALIAGGRCGAVAVYAVLIADWFVPLNEHTSFPTDDRRFVWYAAAAVAAGAIGYHFYLDRTADGPFSLRLMGRALFQQALALGVLLLADAQGNRIASTGLTAMAVWLGAAGVTKLCSLRWMPPLREIFRL